MTAYESILWILRIIATLLVSIILVAVLGLSIPTIDAGEQRADVLAARIAYDDHFSSTPGIIRIEDFTQDAADETVRYFLESGDNTLLVTTSAEASLHETDGSEITTIIYNRPGHQALAPLATRELAEVREWNLPVVLEEGDTTRNGYLHIEVLFDK